MASRIEVELTSKRDDNTWTWRAAGAKQPKGVVESSLLYTGAKVGDIVKADAVFEIEGITIQAIVPPKTKGTIENLIEIKPRNEPHSLITSTLVKKRDAKRGSGRSDRRNPDRPRDSAGSRGPRAESERRDRPRRDDGEGTTPRSNTRDRRPPQQQAERPKPKRLLPLNKHRNAFLATVSAEHRPIAEQLVKGGIPAVRAALQEANQKARAENMPQTPEETVIKIAEDLSANSKIAVWMDRAEAAFQDADEISLRDLRTVVASADSAGKDSDARELAEKLKSKLSERTEKSIAEWLEEIDKALNEGRLVRALRLAARPSEPTAKFPPELAERLIQATNEAMSPETLEERWMTLIDAVAGSPVRRQVVPIGLPDSPSAKLQEFAKENSGRIPALATMLGITIPPPPKTRISNQPQGQRDRNRQGNRRPRPTTSDTKAEQSTPAVEPTAEQSTPAVEPTAEQSTPAVEPTAEQSTPAE